jgi:hypothetical protein
MAYEIRELSFGEILDRGFRLLRDHVVLLGAPAAAIYVPISLVMSLLGPEAAASPEDLAPVLASFALLILLSAIAVPILSAAITHAIGESYLGRPVTIGEALHAGLEVLLPLIGTWILAYLAILGGFLLLIVPGIYLTLAFLLATQVMVLERRFGVGALGRSRELMRGHMLRGFGILLVGTLLVSLLSSGIEIGLGWIPLFGPLAVGLAQGLGFAYTSTLGVLLYFDIRCRKEAFDLEHLSQLVEARTQPVPGI